MTPAKRKRFRTLLEALRAQLSGKDRKKIDPNRADDAEVGGDEDLQPLNEMLQVIASNQNRSAGAVLARIGRALDKLANDPDSFGVCEECGEEIALPRLERMPYAELCVECQGEKDGPKGAPTRRKITDFR
jgi:DnaK suppressor protein